MENQVMGQQQVQEWLSGIEVGEGVHHQNLTLFPLYQRGDEEAVERYRLLEDAVEAKQARVEEISEGGEVPFLGVLNQGSKPILIPEGEILIGAKQNRVVNLTVLVAAKKSFKLPVSCVEAGRWRYQGREFKPAAYAHPRLRDLKMKSAQLNRRQRKAAVADQNAVWSEVDEHLAAFAAAAPTRDLAMSVDAAWERTTDYRQRIELPDGACGFIAAYDGQIAGLDLFDNPATLKKLWSRMSDAYFGEAARRRGKGGKTSRSLAKKFLAIIAARLHEADKQPDLGLELEVDDQDYSGSALFYDGAVCHLSAFKTAAL